MIMKKLFVAFAMIMGLGTVAMAQTQSTEKVQSQTTQSSTSRAPQFTEVNITDVPSLVLDKFKAAYPQAQVSKAATATVNGVLVYKLSYQAADKLKSAYFSVSVNEVK